MLSYGSFLVEITLRLVIVILVTWQFGFLVHSENTQCLHSLKDLKPENNWMLALLIVQLVYTAGFAFWRKNLKPHNYYVEQLMA